MTHLVEVGEALFDLCMTALIVFFFLTGRAAVKAPRVLQDRFHEQRRWMDRLDASGNLRHKSVPSLSDIKVWGWFALCFSAVMGCMMTYKYLLILLFLLQHAVL